MKRGGPMSVLLQRRTILSFASVSLLATAEIAISQGAPDTRAVISGTRGIVLGQAVVNVRELAAREAAAPSSRRKREPAHEPLPGPINLPVPGAAVSGKDPQLTGKIAAGNVVASLAPTLTFTTLEGDSLPRDVAAAAGADRLLLISPNSTRILDKRGEVINTVSATSFWGSLGSNDLLQPRALYDQAINRFVAAILADPQSANASVLFGISETSDPAGNWRLARVKFDPQGQLSPDWLNLGFYNGRIVATANAFNLAPPGSFSRAKIFVVDEHNLYSGNTSATIFDDTTGAGSLAPAVTYDPSITTEYVICNYNGNSNGRGFMRIGAITGPAGSEQYAPSLFLPSVASTWAATSPGNTDFAPQLGSTRKIYLGDDRAQKAINIDGTLFWANTGFVPAAAPTRSVVQFFQLNSNNGAVDQFVRREDELNIDFFATPGLEVNPNRDLALTYNRFSATHYPSVNYSYRAGTDPLNTLRGDVVIKESENPLDLNGRNSLWGSNPTSLDTNDLDMYLYGCYLHEEAGIAGGLVSIPPIATLIGDNGTVGQSFQQPGGAGVSIFPRPAAERVTLVGMEARTPAGAQGTPFALLSGAPPIGNRNFVRSSLNKMSQTWAGGNSFADYHGNPIDVLTNQDLVIGSEGSNFVGDTGPPNPNAPGFYSSPGLEIFRPKTDFNDNSNWMYRPLVEVTSACQVKLFRSEQSFSSNGTIVPGDHHMEGSFLIEDIEGCNPTVIANDPWITITFIRPTARVGHIIVDYRVEANFSPLPRTGVIKIGDQVFKVHQASNVPITPITVSLNSVPAGGEAIPLIVDALPVMLDGSVTAAAQATGFNLRSIVAWNGSSRPTTLVSGTRLKAQISAADIATPGTVRVTVFDVSAGGGTSQSVNFTIASNPLAAVVSAASYLPVLAPESIAAAFGAGLAASTQVAGTNPLPTTLAGTTLRVKDSAGVERLAPLLFVSPGQINFQIPAGTAVGDALLTTTKGDGTVFTRLIQIAIVAPGMFSANASGEGIAAAQALRVKADGSQSYEAVAQFDQVQNKFVSKPIDLGPATDQVFLVAYGTGIRLRSALSAVTATIGGAGSAVLYAGPQGEFVGLDQLNVLIPRSLIGRGDANFIVVADGQTANTVLVNIK